MNLLASGSGLFGTGKEAFANAGAVLEGLGQPGQSSGLHLENRRHRRVRQQLRWRDFRPTPQHTSEA
jgi:hypothetical protein